MGGWNGSLGLSAYRNRKRSLIPNSIGELMSSQRLIDHYIQSVYGYRPDQVESIGLRQLTHGGVQGNLSDSARIQVELTLKKVDEDVKNEAVDSDGDDDRRRGKMSSLPIIFNWFVKIRRSGASPTGGFDVFRNEIEFYKRILPHMRQFLAGVGGAATDFDIDVPEILYASEEADNGRAIIILKDVIADGYRHIKDEHGNRFLSREMAELAVASLARIHAVSKAIQEQKQQELGAIYPTLVQAGLLWTNDDMKSKLNTMKETYIEMVKTSSELDSPRLLEKFERSFASDERLDELCHQRCERDDSVTSSCLQHGDFHFNNLLFKETGEGELKVMIVDWQLAYSGKATGDISYLLLSSLSSETRELYEGQIKEHYFNSFKNTLDRLAKTNCKLELMDTEYQGSLPLSFFLSCGNIMSVEEEDKCIRFSYEMLKEAVQKEII